MGYDIGACGAFGIYLPDCDGEVGELYKSLSAAAAAAVATWKDNFANDREDYMSPSELIDQQVVDKARVDGFVAAFERIGVVVPDGAWLVYTGDEDDRGGRCDTPPGEFVLGWGMHTKPWDYPPMDESFRKVADLHTWHWAG